MTPPPPKIIFPTADPEPPSTHHSSNHHTPTVQYHPNPSLSPSIIIQLTPFYNVEILTSPNPVENPNLATPALTIRISSTSTPVRTVEKKYSETPPPKIPIIQTPAFTVETNRHLQSPSNTIHSTPVPPTVETMSHHSPLSATASPFNPRALFTPRRKRRPYNKRFASLIKTKHVITTPETHHPVEKPPLSPLHIRSHSPYTTILDPVLDTRVPPNSSYSPSHPNKYPSVESPIVETQIPALAVESLPPIRKSSPTKESVQSISPALQQYMVDIFEWEYDGDNPPTILEDNKIFTMKDLSSLQYFKFLTWQKGRICDHMDIELLIRWCISNKQSIYEFTPVIYDNIMNNDITYDLLESQFTDLENYITHPATTSTPLHDSIVTPPPTSTHSTSHTSSTTKYHPSESPTPTITTTLADEAPSHIRAIFDKCTNQILNLIPTTTRMHT